MEQSFVDENITSGNNEIIKECMNDVILEKKKEGNSSVHTNPRRNPKNDIEQLMKINLKKLHVQRKYWKPHGRNYLCWGVFCINDNVEVDLENTQMMRCILCYHNLVIIINPRTQVRK